MRVSSWLNLSSNLAGPIVAAISNLTNADEHHQERRLFHLGSVNLVTKLLK